MYSYFRTITIDHTLVGEDDADFAFLFRSTLADLRTFANGGEIQNTDAAGGASGAITVPADLVFSPNKDGSSEYDFEVEKYNAVTGELIAWVQSGVSVATDTVLYLVYGDVTVVVSQENVPGTWDAGFKMVHHFPGPTFGSCDDSTSNANDISGEVGNPTYGDWGTIGSGVIFDSNDLLTVADSDSLDAYGAMTIEMWFYQQSAGVWHGVLGKGDMDPAQPGATYYSLYNHSTTRLYFGVCDIDNDASIGRYSTGDLVEQTAEHLVMIWDGGTTCAACKIYLNTVQVDDTDYAGGAGFVTMRQTNTDLKFLAVYIGTTLYYGYGAIDELRISSVARSADYLTTCFNNQDDPGSFYGVSNAVSLTLEASLKLSVQGGLMELLSGHVVYPQFFCCVSGTSTGVDKTPVALIRADNVYVCVGAVVCIDILGSWSPTSTIATYNVDWGDGNNSPGAWAPAGDICHPLGGYAVADTYDITLSVVDLLGVTDSDIVQIEVIDCAHLPPFGPPDPGAPPCYPPCRMGCDPTLGMFILVGSNGAGPFYTLELDGGATVWNQFITGLPGGGARTGHVIQQYEWSNGLYSIFMGTDVGIYEYAIPPMYPYSGTWVLRQSTAQLLAAVGSIGTVRVWDIQMVADNEDYEGWGYCSFGGSNCGVSVCHTRDGWQTLHSGSQARGGAGSGLRPTMCAPAHHTPTTVYVTNITWTEPARLLRSTISASMPNWPVIDSRVLGEEETVVHVPWNSQDWNDQYIYWGGTSMVRRSIDGGASFADIVSMGRPYHMNGPSYDADMIWMGCWNPGGYAKYWDPIGGLQNFGPVMVPFAGHCYDAAPIIFDPFDAACNPLRWLLVGDGGGAPGLIKLNTAIGTTTCTGDWNIKTGSVRALSIMRTSVSPLNLGL